MNSTVCQEHQDLLSEFIELTGREKCKSVSFLDEEQDLPWKATVVKFIKEGESEGYHFKTSDESLEELKNTYLKEQGDEEWFESVFEGGFSDNDNALDNEGQPSDCDEPKQVGKNPHEGSDSLSDKLLTEFYEYLVDVDGGYQSEKIARQYKAQVESVICMCQLKLTENEAEELRQQNLPAVHLLLLPGKDGVKV